ncbi:hypothetical protein DICVIV_06427 [Dictyocaulus viviparus]|uniref:Uncharacterized protein n=1 Tax=Dictyocaulus viviparus TaxID=29172 RepID=A0A0D8XUP9_DICVI|nr:hypothetical protein DICVIV_06427 [Dictyocaulus viviparus]
MSTMITMVAFVLSLVNALANDNPQQNIKNATAAGQYGHSSTYYEQDFVSEFNFNPFSFGRYPDTLLNTHVCSVDASYAVYSDKHSHRSRHRRPLIEDCSNAFNGVYDRNKANNGFSLASCNKCCKKAAILNKMTEYDIVGMVLVMNKKIKCACCAPHRPFDTIVALPVQYPIYSQYQPLQYHSNNDKPTGY